jgi:hypothetical protein
LDVAKKLVLVEGGEFHRKNAFEAEDNEHPHVIVFERLADGAENVLNEGKVLSGHVTSC